jgi:dethiobiotin synthetase
MRNRRGIFITGTDTGVGKTYLAAGIARLLHARGIDVGVMKPAETGCIRRNGKLVPSDALVLMKAAGVHDRLHDVNHYRFKKPLAPSVAAATEGSSIDPARIRTGFDKLCRKHSFMIVEGAGGIMVPLTERYTYLDLAVDLRLPVMIVARPGLGTINHTLLTIEVLRRRGIAIAGVVINFADDRRAGTAERTNPGVIQKLACVDILGVIRYKKGGMGELVGKLSSLLPEQEGAATMR